MFIRPMWGGTCSIAETYASTALAESSGDWWCDGAEITITGGPVYIYYDALAVDGYSGLIHKEPYGASNGTMDAVALGFSEAEGDDPDLWTGWSDDSVGVKGDDYDYDTSGGLARLRDLFNGGLYTGKVNRTRTFGQQNAEAFSIMDRCKADIAGGTATGIAIIDLYLYANIDTSNTAHARLRAERDADSTTWRYFVGGATLIDTGVSRLTEIRISRYVKNNRTTFWFGDESTPSVNVASTSNEASTANSRIRHNVGGITVSSGTSDFYIGAQVGGGFTTV